MRCCCAAVLFLGSLLHAQTPGSAAKIIAALEENWHRLPDFACTETIERFTRRPPHKFWPVERIRLRAAYLRGGELYGWIGSDKLDEPHIEKLAGSNVWSGEFARLFKSVFDSNLAELQDPGEVSLDGRRALRVDFRVPKEAQSYILTTPSQKFSAGFHGTAWVDAESLELIRVRAALDDAPRAAGLLEQSITADYGRVQIGGASIVLPRRIEILARPASGGEDRIVARFDACEPFAAPAANAGKQVALPADFTAEVSLLAPIDITTDAVGDTVRLALKQDIVADHQVLVAKGAILVGRISALRYSFGSVVAGIEIWWLESPTGRVDVRGRVNELITLFPPAAALEIAPGVHAWNNLYLQDHAGFKRGTGFFWRSRKATK